MQDFTAVVYFSVKSLFSLVFCLKEMLLQLLLAGFFIQEARAPKWYDDQSDYANTFKYEQFWNLWGLNADDINHSLTWIDKTPIQMEWFMFTHQK